MDNVSHTLVGAALAQSGLGKRTALAGPALVIGANLPDIDAITYLLFDSDTAFWFRRGWTHGVPALILWPLILTGALLIWNRMRARRQVNSLQLLWLSAIGIWSHPCIDWLNNYGLRWLMPLDERWFYGDAVFIIDPWIWLAGGRSDCSCQRPFLLLREKRASVRPLK